MGAGGRLRCRAVGVAAVRCTGGTSALPSPGGEASPSESCAWWRPAASRRPVVPAPDDRPAFLSLDLQEESDILKIMRMVAARCLTHGACFRRPPRFPLCPFYSERRRRATSSKSCAWWRPATTTPASSSTSARRSARRWRTRQAAAEHVGCFGVFGFVTRCTDPHAACLPLTACYQCVWLVAAALTRTRHACLLCCDHRVST